VDNNEESLENQLDLGADPVTLDSSFHLDPLVDFTSLLLSLWKFSAFTGEFFV